ncbi:hypothetical protein [Nannocystis punicea]|uniref:Uncharacterized protein n=1 Tax=Nannocystis punicea TaxID=2995304 RepID=A0ABY7H3M4_9BACT|nr:hypothetical protein [Nannocystis poenicansa]WAS93707.1 hypothetical protein O0S08_46840 [Nannocystis poenicansa]
MPLRPCSRPRPYCIEPIESTYVLASNSQTYALSPAAYCIEPIESTYVLASSSPAYALALSL